MGWRVTVWMHSCFSVFVSVDACLSTCLFVYVSECLFVTLVSLQFHHHGWCPIYFNKHNGHQLPLQSFTPSPTWIPLRLPSMWHRMPTTYSPTGKPSFQGRCGKLKWCTMSKMSWGKRLGRCKHRKEHMPRNSTSILFVSDYLPPCLSTVYLMQV